MRRVNKFLSIVAAACALSLVGSGVALAEDVKVDNDTANGVQNTRSFTVSPSAPINTSAVVVLNYNGSKHLVAGTSVGFAETSSLPSGAILGDLVIDVPATGWDAQSDFVTASASVAFNAPSIPGDYTYSVTYTPNVFQCVDGDDKCLTGSASMTVNVTVSQTTGPPVACVGAPTATPPTLVPTGSATAWRNTAPSVSASTTTGTVQYTTDSGATWSTSAPVVTQGTTTVGSRSVVMDGATLCNSAAGNSETYMVDTEVPMITDAALAASPVSPTGTSGANGWYWSAVLNTFTATDNLSGFSGQSNPHNFTQSSGINEGPAVTISSGVVNDLAGNEATAIDSQAFKIDLNNPTNVTFVGGPTGDHTLGSVPAAPTCSATDTVDTSVDCVVTGYGTTIGSHTLTATATDDSGRNATATRTYRVIYKWSGFFQPIDTVGGMGKDSYAGTTQNTIYNKVKAGSGVPVKFSLDGYQGVNPIAEGYPLVANAVCSSSAPSDVLEETVGVTASVLKYDAAANNGAGQYIYTWKTGTTGWAGTCKRLEVKLIDGTSHFAFFNFTK